MITDLILLLNIITLYNLSTLRVLHKLLSVKNSSEPGFEGKCSVPNQENLWKAHDSKLRILIEFLSPL